MARTEIIDTTVGELVAALTEEAAQLINNKRDVNKVVAFMLTHLLNESCEIARRRQSCH